VRPPSAATAPVSTNAEGIAASLMACMATRPCAGARRRRARITKAEHAKNTPATTPQPSAVGAVSPARSPCVARRRQRCGRGADQHRVRLPCSGSRRSARSEGRVVVRAALREIAAIERTWTRRWHEAGRHGDVRAALEAALGE